MARCQRCYTDVCQCDINPIIARLEEIRKALDWCEVGSLGEQLDDEINNLKIKFGFTQSPAAMPASAVRDSKDKIMKIKVTYWAGTTQKTKLVIGYNAAQKLVSKEHRNAYDPRFETEDGETLVDTGEFFVTESEAAKSNPTVYA